MIAKNPISEYRNFKNYLKDFSNGFNGKKNANNKISQFDEFYKTKKINDQKIQTVFDTVYNL